MAYKKTNLNLDAEVTKEVQAELKVFGGNLSWLTRQLHAKWLKELKQKSKAKEL